MTRLTLARLLELAAARRPTAEAVVDGARRLDYAELRRRPRASARGLRRLGVEPGDRVLIALKNRLEHVARLLGAPDDRRRARAGELPRRRRRDALRARGLRRARRAVRDDTAPAVRDRGRRPWHAAGVRWSRRPRPRAPCRSPICSTRATAATPGSPTPTESDLSLILYTSGTTGRPKGVPRTHRNHYAGALAHALQCGYEWGERTLGVMPLYHTMGIHSLTSMAAVNGCFVCQPDWSAREALALIAAGAAHRALPDPHALLRPRARAGASRDRRRVGAQARLRRRADAGGAHRGVREGLRAGGVRQPLRLDRDLHVLGPARRPPQAGLRRAAPGLHSALRVVTATTERRVGPDEIVPPGEKGEIIASLDSDEAFAGYWNRPDADAQGAARRLVLHRRHGLPRRRRRALRVAGASTT